ncbi:MAG: dTDP-4-dehydrorhamnose reductase [Phycisphaerae bacterium]|nr:dTDP-4-dehydrorhamnose reductase [Phycisphaerae bacterium]NIP52794.1 dTDP-4-dehydrorhamnose reductase [Phycisphaerae bacterium]NIS51810.1 dTDP-4-dehydrorhamnose reductase [Phycisphaerae bacterium]NIU09339.1 dTDP-4-dehydrorhamnose reductase [Phycisphaerae bacterium]NIU57063.1 dTDP-4-dehydrorhamnose reductase [Phycisphaerae bacterium]
MVTKDTRIAILGGTGMLGSDLVDSCKQHFFDVIVFDLPEFDIRNSQQLKQAVSAADIIVNCAAYTDVDGAETEAEMAYQVNAEAVGRLGAIVQDSDKWLLHISTDFVFDGRLDAPYVETDLPNPINEYGKSKLAGEQLLVESGCRHCIIRIEWTYGVHGDNFVKKIIQRAKTAETVKVIDDQIGSPTATTEVADIICKILPKTPTGIFHFANAGYVSRYEMAKFIIDKLSTNVNLLPCKTGDFVSAAERPLNSRFDCSKIKDLLDEQIEPWWVPLEHFLRKL